MGAVNVLPAPTVTLPALRNGLLEGKFRPPWVVKLPAAALGVKFARALTLDVLTMAEDEPSRVMAAALVRTSALVNRRVPATRYEPPVRVVPAKLVRVLRSRVPAWTSTEPALLKA